MMFGCRSSRREFSPWTDLLMIYMTKHVIGYIGPRQAGN